MSLKMSLKLIVDSFLIPWWCSLIELLTVVFIVKAQAPSAQSVKTTDIEHPKTLYKRLKQRLGLWLSSLIKSKDINRRITFHSSKDKAKDCQKARKLHVLLLLISSESSYCCTALLKIFGVEWFCLVHLLFIYPCSVKNFHCDCYFSKLLPRVNK